MNAMRLLAYGKINKTLHITGKRTDGYHTLESLMVPISLHDILILEQRDRGFLFTGNRPHLINEDNYVVRAHRLMERLAGRELPCRIHLMKRIPEASGLAGGTADGAAIIHGLNAIYELGFSLEELQKEALGLGADFPFCLGGQGAFAEGIGEILTPKEIPSEELLLVLPDFSLSTPRIYDLYDQNPVTHPQNDLLPGAVEKYPPLRKLLEAVRATGPREFGMSGSGPTVFAFYDSGREEGARKLSSEGYQVILCETM